MSGRGHCRSKRGKITVPLQAARDCHAGTIKSCFAEPLSVPSRSSSNGIYVPVLNDARLIFELCLDAD